MNVSMLDLLLKDFCLPVGLHLRGEIFYKFDLTKLGLPEEDHNQSVRAVREGVTIILVVFEGKLSSVQSWHPSREEPMASATNTPDSFADLLQLIRELAFKA